MTKRELLKAVKEIRKICGENVTREDCANCAFNINRIDSYGCLFSETLPEDWDIELLERGEDGRENDFTN